MTFQISKYQTRMMMVKSPYQIPLNLTLRTLRVGKLHTSLSFTFANKDQVTNFSNTTSETEDETNHLNVKSVNQSIHQSNNQSVKQSINQPVNQSVNQSKQRQRQFAKDSLRAHLKVVDQEKYSKIPKTTKEPITKEPINYREMFDTGSTFTSSIRSEIKRRSETKKLKCNTGYRITKNPYYNETKFDKANIIIK